MSSEIVKIQVPLMPRNGLALIYDQNHERTEFRRVDTKIREALAGDPKGYFKAKFIQGKWVIGKRVDDQPW